ncbi:MAG: RHS repeat-associated core domain-containing protein [Bacteroidales bacterium]|nr:RHS repeat-associated core domain-containing protein [Bacteroidales bacterium]
MKQEKTYGDSHAPNRSVPLCCPFFSTFSQKTPSDESPKMPIFSACSAGSFSFTFTGKEKDSESGFYYFGARYYDCDLSGLFLSVDPMSDKYPGLSPYAYCAWNPIKIIDPNGDTCKFANEESEAYVRQLLDAENRNYSEEFANVYNDLESDTHNYLFEIWNGDEKNDGLFIPKSRGENISSILFTKGETSDTKNPNLGMSEFKILFEETFHAWKYKTNGHYQYITCYSEALAWIFSARAPGTKYFIDKQLNPTLMGYVLCTPPEILAIEFKFGFFDKFGGIKIPALYPNLEVFPNNKLRMIFGYPEWK